jgi:hypothetical protein
MLQLFVQKVQAAQQAAEAKAAEAKAAEAKAAEAKAAEAKAAEAKAAEAKAADAQQAAQTTKYQYIYKALREVCTDDEFTRMSLLRQQKPGMKSSDMLEQTVGEERSALVLRLWQLKHQAHLAMQKALAAQRDKEAAAAQQAA